MTTNTENNTQEPEDQNNIINSTEDDFYTGVADDTVFEEQQTEGDALEVKAEGTPEVKPTETPAKPDSGISPDLAKSIGEEVAKSIKSSQTQPDGTQKPLTPEERDKILKRFHVTGDLLTKMGFQDAKPEQIEAFQGMLDAAAQHAFTMSDIRVRALEQQIEQRIAPLQQAHQEMAQQQAESVFYGKYPDLKQYPLAVKHAAQSVTPTKPDGSYKSNDEIIQEVANESISVIKQFNPQFSLKATHSAPTQQPGQPAQQAGQKVVAQSQTPTMAGVMSGGRSQGSTSAPGSDEPGDADIY